MSSARRSPILALETELLRGYVRARRDERARPKRRRSNSSELKSSIYLTGGSSNMTWRSANDRRLVVAPEIAAVGKMIAALT